MSNIEVQRKRIAGLTPVEAAREFAEWSAEWKAHARLCRRNGEGVDPDHELYNGRVRQMLERRSRGLSVPMYPT